MAITNLDAPAEGSLHTCHSPIIFDATFEDRPPVAYCDIYVSGNYQATITATAPMVSGASFSIFRWDISAILQPLFHIEPPNVNTLGIVPITNGRQEVFVRLRESFLDPNGFIQPEAPIPVQGTLTTAPVEGGGHESPTFIVLPITIEDWDGGEITPYLLSLHARPCATGYHILTARPKRYFVPKDGSDFIAFLKPDANREPTEIRVHFREQETSTEQTAVIPILSYSDPGVYLIPSGPGQLSSALGFNLNQCHSYWLEIFTQDPESLVSTGDFIITPSCMDSMTLLFQNAFGTLDGLTLDKVAVERSVKSSPFITRRGLMSGRVNIASKDTMELRNGQYGEDEQPWLSELLASPACWQVLPNGRYRDMTVMDGDMRLFKEEGRYRYDTIIKVEPSRQRKTQRR